MTFRQGHLECDTPGCGAIVPAESEEAALWTTLAGNDERPAHLCDRCTAEPARVRHSVYRVKCAQCGASSDGDPEGVWFEIADAVGRRLTVCEDCHSAGGAAS